MKNLKIKLATVLAAIVLSFGWVLSPVAVSAEETTLETSESVSVEEIIEEEKTSEKTAENSEVLEGETNTFENFLAWTEKEADRYGYGDEYRLAFEDIKNAATTKQVTLSTLASAGMLLFFIGYMVYKKVTDKKALSEIKSIAAQVIAQGKKINELVDAINNNSKTEETIKKETDEVKVEIKKTEEAISGLISGFMHFAESVKLKETKKDEVRRDCTNALKKIDGGVVSNENNENNKE
jgi:hypothetical protein